jgi:hypothetical protein
MARKLSIVLAVVLAIFAASPNLGYAQGRGWGFHGGGGGFHGGGFGFRGGGSVVAAGALVGAGAEAGFGSRDGAGHGVRAAPLLALTA